MSTFTHTCLVCGYPRLEFAPRSINGGGSYEICPSCGFQFGVDDDDREITYEQARQTWIDLGYPWSSKGIAKTPRWSGKRQLDRYLKGPKLTRRKRVPKASK